MLQTLYCPRCMARVVCGERYCGNCGARLTWAVRPAQPGDNATPLSKEIAKLLTDFEQHLKCSRPG